MTVAVTGIIDDWLGGKKYNKLIKSLMQKAFEFSGKPVFINVKEFASKFRSKYEVY